MNVIEFVRRILFLRRSDDPTIRLPKAILKNPTYENFWAQCPTCKRWNTFNRASDIGSFQLVTNMAVKCEYPDCQQQFTIRGDWINPAWQMLILDCEDLKSHKYYSYCILNLAQAFEMFFALYLRVHFLYKPYARENPDTLDEFNKCSLLLYDTTRKYSYSKMRNIFLNLILSGTKYETLAKSTVGISQLCSITTEPSDDAIRALQESEMSNSLLKLKQCDVSNLRNDVVHKRGYRPTLTEVETALDETSTILNKLNRLLGQPTDEIHFYSESAPAIH